MTPALAVVEFEVTGDPDGFVLGVVRRTLAAERAFEPIDRPGPRPLAWLASVSTYDSATPRELRNLLDVRPREFPHTDQGLEDATGWLLETWQFRQRVIGELLDNLRALQEQAHPTTTREGALQ